MFKNRRNDFIIPTLAVIFDAFAIEAAFLFSYWLRFSTDVFYFLPLTEDSPPFEAYLYGSFVVVPIWLFLFKSRSMYESRRNVDLSDDFFNIVKLVTLGMLIVMSAAFFYRAFSYSRVVFGLLWVSATVFIFIGRVILYHVEKAFYKMGMELRNAAIIGNSYTAERIFKTFNQNSLLGYKIIGYFADTKAKPDSILSEAQYIGCLEDVPKILINERIELLMVALNSDEHEKLFQLVKNCEGVNVEFLMVPDILEIMVGQVRVKEIESIPFIKIKGIPMTTWGLIVKRTFDICISILLLILLLPFLLVIAVLIKLSSTGPVFYKQERVGLNGKKFMMLKFRSMKKDAEKETGPTQTKENDPRRTKIGVFLRKTSIDELPQLLNVIKGDMSLVGPRPERPFFVEQFREFIPKYLDRHRVKTGMTGWAQINGLRGGTSIEERIRYDIYYIENWSLWFDIKILLKTLRAILSIKNVH